MAAAICANATVCIGCDLCGCYTPQLEAMPQNEEHHLFFGLYAAVAEQFTYFGTVQIDGSDRAWSFRWENSVVNWPPNFQSRSITPRYKSCPTIGFAPVLVIGFKA